MLNIQEKLQEATAEAVQKLYEITIEPGSLQVSETNKEFEGDYTVVVFPLSRYKLGAPHQLAEKIGEYLLSAFDWILRYNVIKGFLNLKFTDAFWCDFLADQNGDASYFKRTEGKGQRVLVEYPSPNTNKPLHLGHLRNIALGFSLGRALEANGFEVVSACLFNDRGVAICKSMYGFLHSVNPLSPETSGKKGDHLVGDYYVAFSKENSREVEELVAKGRSKEEALREAKTSLAIQDMLVKWEAGDPEVRALWEKMNGWVYKGFEETFRKLGVEFDKYYHESELYKLGKKTVEEGIKDGHFFQKEDGSVWIDLTEAGLDEKNLIRSNGTTGYITQDIGVADVKYQDFAMDRSVYVVADEQNYHFRVLFEILAKLGRPYVDGLYHFSYGMVDLTTGKMKSREGTTVDADDLVADVIAAAEAETQSHKEEMGKIAEMSEDELAELYRILGLGALKFYLLKVDPKKRMIFDPVESVALRGDTAPYVQYAYARVQSILRKAAEMEGIASFSAGMRREEPLHEAEITVLRRIYDYRRILKEAADSYNLSLFANFSLDLARDLNRFYHECKVLNPDQPVTSAFRLALSGFAGETIRQAMTILGIEVPDRM